LLGKKGYVVVVVVVVTSLTMLFFNKSPDVWRVQKIIASGAAF